MRYVLVPILVCIMSCKVQKEAQPQGDPDIVLVAQDGFSGILDYEAGVIRDVKSLNKFYSRINRTRKPGLPVPTIDFSKEMVVVLCLGSQKGEKVPVLSRSNESETGVSLALELSNNASDKGLESEVVSYPFYVYKMPLSSKKMDIQKKGW
ncbi:hypothetical protein [Flagellimonas myxillae]|uniref:hypothetical protein n=1 Tax=Flagellimonas myxillae TaxID=2942214 RepID=UPI00201EC6F2|nr:hypothetical protein [Muricauda myxillae]MCL6266253.1 hypothetical protein [Muricauda myxillae]